MRCTLRKGKIMTRPKKLGPPRRSRTYRLPENLIELLEQLARRNRRPTTGELEIAIEDHLKRSKLWPPRQKK
jgi:hypothetical protein